VTEHLTLIDPEKETPERVGKIAEIVERAGSSAIMIGGSTGIDQERLDEIIMSAKNHSSLKTILFPSSSAMLSEYADAIFFMTLLNSRERKYLIEEQARGAIFVKRSSLEVLSMGYLVIGEGQRVGEVGRVERVEENELGKIIGYALAAQFFGMKYFYLEKGSGASKPISPAVIGAVRDEIDISLIVGGGIRDAEQASEISDAGADYVVTGTLVEDLDLADLEGALRALIKALK